MDTLIQHSLREQLQHPLPGTGRPPDVEVFLDGGTVGQYYSRCRDQALYIGLAYSIPTPPYTAVVLVDVVNEEADGRAAAAFKHLAAAFDRLGPGGLERWCRERFAVTVGDGALAPGGSNKKLALNTLWGQGRPRRDVVDMFHLVDRAGKKALRANAGMLLLCDVLRQLEFVFGLGHGRHVSRCVAAFLEEPNLACMTPCGTRRAGYLAVVPRRFLIKYRQYYCGLMVRMQHALSSRGKHSFKALRDIGDKMGNPSLLIFAHGLAAGMAHSVEPFARHSQDARTLPWVRWRKANEAQQRLQEESPLITWWRGRLVLASCLAAYLPRSDPGLRRLWQAWCLSAHGRRACVCPPGLHLGAALWEIVVQGSYKNNTLHLPVSQPEVLTYLTHPTCQCTTRMARQAAGQPPAWVTASTHSRAYWKHACAMEGPGSAAPRTQLHASSLSLPNHGCRVPWRSQAAFEAADTGLCWLQQLWCQWSSAFQACCLGPTGLTPAMQEIFTAMATCWWLEDPGLGMRSLCMGEGGSSMGVEQHEET